VSHFLADARLTSARDTSHMIVQPLQKEAATTITRAIAAVAPGRQIGWVAALTFLAWLGEGIHNGADLPSSFC
jgi:hypothetical protein